jgi:ferric-dicitrate binding protein FerR (iron transport regulator)
MNRLDDLINRFVDDDLAPEERIELQRTIDLDPRGADQLLECYQQDRVLAALCRPASAPAIDAILAAVLQEDPFVDSTMRQTAAEALRGSLVRAPQAEPAHPARLERREQPTTTAFHAWFQRFVPRRAWAIALTTLAFIAVISWLFPRIDNQPTLSLSAGTHVTLQRNGQHLSVESGIQLVPGDLLSVSATNRAGISYGAEPTSITLLDDTELKILSWKRGKRFELRVGKIEASVARQRPFRPMIIGAPQAEARVVGTRFTLSVTNNATRLDVAEGKVSFTRKRDLQTVRVVAGHYALAGEGYELSALAFTGSILREFWDGVSAKTLYDLQKDSRFLSHPDRSGLSSRFELVPVTTNRLAVRFRGYLHPPVSGDYEFWLSGATDAKLFMSPSERPEDKEQIAQTAQISPTTDASRTKAWDAPRFRGPTQWSSPIPLVAGHCYYVEALLLIEHGEGHLSVAWKCPGRPREVLTGEFLSPAEQKK